MKSALDGLVGLLHNRHTGEERHTIRDEGHISLRRGEGDSWLHRPVQQKVDQQIRWCPEWARPACGVLHLRPPVIDACNDGFRNRQGTTSGRQIDSNSMVIG
jgi:hypothetical protein